VASGGKAGTTRPDDVPDEVWAEAVHRAVVSAPLAREDCLTRVRVRDAARELGLSLPSAYRLIALYRKNSVAASLVPHHPGPAKGARRLPTRMEAIVECAITAVHAQRERPTLARLQRDVRSSLPGAGTLSMGAVHAPVGGVARRGSALPARALVRGRFSHYDAGSGRTGVYHQRS